MENVDKNIWTYMYNLSKRLYFSAGKIFFKNKESVINSKFIKIKKMATALIDNYPKEIIEEMEGYDELLNEAISTKSTTFLPNSGANHASLMMSKMFDNTTEEMYLVVRCFDGAVSGKPNYLNSLRKCLFEKKVKAHVLILGKDEDNLGIPRSESDAYKMFLEAKDERKNKNDIELFYATNDTIKLLERSFDNLNSIPNFGLFDTDKLRFEASPETYSGWGSFNCQERVTKFKKIFQEASKVSKSSLN